MSKRRTLQFSWASNDLLLLLLLLHSRWCFTSRIHTENNDVKISSFISSKKNKYEYGGNYDYSNEQNDKTICQFLSRTIIAATTTQRVEHTLPHLRFCKNFDTFIPNRHINAVQQHISHLINQCFFCVWWLPCDMKTHIAHFICERDSIKKCIFHLRRNWENSQARTVHMKRSANSPNLFVNKTNHRQTVHCGFTVPTFSN